MFNIQKFRLRLLRVACIRCKELEDKIASGKGDAKDIEWKDKLRDVINKLVILTGVEEMMKNEQTRVK
jgi:hypothetical protein